MARFDRQVATAKRLIDLNGESVTITVYSSNVPDSNAPMETGPSTEQTVSARAVFLNYNTKEAGQTYADGTDIHRDDKKVLVAASGLTVQPNLQGTIKREDGTVFRIIKINLLDPANQKIRYELQVRR